MTVPRLRLPGRYLSCPKAYASAGVSPDDQIAGRAARWLRPHHWCAGSVLAATRVRMARTATDKVATVNRSVSQISVRVCAARCTADSFRFTHSASRCSGVAGPVTVRTLAASAACAEYRSSRSAPRASVFHLSSRGRATI